MTDYFKGNGSLPHALFMQSVHIYIAGLFVKMGCYFINLIKPRDPHSHIFGPGNPKVSHNNECHFQPLVTPVGPNIALLCVKNRALNNLTTLQFPIYHLLYFWVRVAPGYVLFFTPITELHFDCYLWSSRACRWRRHLEEGSNNSYFFFL